MDVIENPKPEETTTMSGKKKKPPKLTKAEKKKLKKQRALEKKRLAAEKQRQQKRDFLVREMKYNEINRKKLERKWRKMLFDIKIPALRKEFRYVVNNIERLFDVKDFKISILMDEVDEASDQTGVNNRNHLETLGKLVEVFREQLEHLKTKYDLDLRAVTQDELTSINFLSKRRDFNDEYLNMMLYGLDVENKHEIKNIRSEYMSKIGGETTWYGQVLMNRKIEIQSAFDNMYQQYMDIFNDFLNAENRKDYERIKQTDMQNRELLTQQSNKILFYYETLKKLKDAQELQKKELRTIEMQMIEEKLYFTEAFNILKNRLIVNERADRNKLIDLTEKSNNVINHLREIKEKGEKILKLMTLSSKYETQMEQILPFPSMTEDERSLKNMISTRMHSKVSFGTHIEMSNTLRPYWQKFAAVDSTRHILKEEELLLKRENEYLRKKIKKYCEMASCRCILPQVTPLRKPKKKPKPKIEAKIYVEDL